MICSSCNADNGPEVEVCFSCGRHLTALIHGSVIASRYEVLKQLGKGGMGVVYEARDRLLDETVAIKVLRSEFIGTSEMAQRFRSEIKLARKVSHPNVCRIHEYGEDGHISYISMALIEGIDLKKLLGEHPDGLPLDQAFHLAVQVTDGLQAIHDVGIIHRDLKTANIVLDKSNVARLMDFGIAKETNRKDGFTATGEVVGTPEYMSPEQCRGAVLDFRSDVYSLGIVLYEIFTGRLPFRGETLMATLMMQVQEPPPLESLSLPPGVVAVLRRALAKDPKNRYESAGRMAEALRESRKSPAKVPTASDVPMTTMLPTFQERRKDSRFDINVEMLLRKHTAGGAVLQEERTIANNIGKKGARLLTTMTGIAAGDSVSVQEVGGPFHARSVVRHVAPKGESVTSLGVEFLDGAVPHHLLPVDLAARPARAHTPQAFTPTRITPPRVTPPPSPAAEERRKNTRLDISVDILLKRLGPAGTVLQEERTVADNISLHGARVLTTMQSLSAGDHFTVVEVGGKFQARSVVRHVFEGKESVRRLGLEFLDQTAPEHLLPTDGSKPRMKPVVPRPAPQPPVSAAERRRDSRLEITVDVFLKRLGPSGEVLQEERTIIDNIARRGARVLTSMTAVEPGSTVSIHEVGGDFATKATVRSSHLGPDNIRRLGIEFVDRGAPDRLVPDGDSQPRMTRATGSTPVPMAPAEPPRNEADPWRQEILATFQARTQRNHFEVLGIPRASNAAQVKQAYFALTRRFHPDVRLDVNVADLKKEVQAIYIRINEAYETLVDVEKRSRYETMLGHSRSTPRGTPVVTASQPSSSAPQEAPQQQGSESGRAVEKPSPEESGPAAELQKAEAVLRNARKLVAEQKYWDAIQSLEASLELAKGTKANQSIRVLLGIATRNNPKWGKRAEEILLSVVREDDQCAEAHWTLGEIYEGAGLRTRAIAQFRRFLDLQPGNPAAQAKLQALERLPGSRDDSSPDPPKGPMRSAARGSN